MMNFTDYLTERIEAGGFTTEDALASFLPLVRQVENEHRAGSVAPLQGVNAVRVEGNRLWYEESHARKPIHENARILEKEEAISRGVEVVGQYRMDILVEHGVETVASLEIGQRGVTFERPVFLPGYVCWEHELGHHDPLCDVFVLGLVLASLCCGLDLNDPEDLETFVRHRRNLFELNANLHPVLAKAIVRMTALRRSQRPQDLASLLHTLENYREQNVDFEFDLARMPDFRATDRTGRRALILGCLQKRLFDISKRNRLLHFRATGQSVNLTWASVPLSFDVKNIRPEQILTWDHEFKKAIVAGETVSLNGYLRFDEALYLPGQLDQIRNEARRDQTEYGFAQLRLVIVFLRWTNLKEKPPERFDSPLVLLPVKLARNKGVRDTFALEPVGTEAEINPVLRFQLKQLYAVDLPETVDLAKTSLDELHAYLAGKVQSSEPAVTVEKIDRPRINIIHAKAQRRLEQYRRRVRLSGRGVRSFLDIDYSYDRTNYHPLGLRLFQTRVAPVVPRLRTIVEESPRPRMHMSPAAEDTSTKERQLYTQVEDETNPYRWEFDLCNVTLGNFHYRKMSLVRDYAVLLDRSGEHPAFDAIFSLEPREVAGEALPLPPLAERFPIVNCDPTQASAIARARTGKHFIIQGPPGTGKSQTITNLIADFAAQGKRVLFVCEKRAAIDVVYHRLRQSGLHELCCLIHDAQDDKKEFIADLKATYETFQERTAKQIAKADRDRQTSLDKLQSELAPLEHFHAVMRSTPTQAGEALHRIVERAVELRGSTPTLEPRERETLPTHNLWHEHRGTIERVRDHLESAQPDGVLANHPLRSLHDRFGRMDRPLAAVHELLPRCKTALAAVRAELQPIDVPAECLETVARILQLVDYATELSGLAELELLGVLKPKSDLAKRLAAFRKKLNAKEQQSTRARAATTGWRHKLPPADTRAALDQSRRQERSLLRFLQPSWWKLRGLLRRNYDFETHDVRPAFSQVLEPLDAEHQRIAELAAIENEAREEFSFPGTFAEFSQQVASFIESASRRSPTLQVFHRHVLASDDGDEIAMALAKLQPELKAMVADLNQLMSDVDDRSLPLLAEELDRIGASLDKLPGFVPCLKELGTLPPPVASAWRRFPHGVREFEAAVVSHTLDDILTADPPANRFTAKLHARHVAKLEPLHDEWQSANANLVRDRVCGTFLENLRISSLAHAHLTAEQKEFKTRYNRGRRELEHEFGKTMRYRSIRDLIDGDSGLVLRDLKPIWLMSPLSVADALPLDHTFDVVIFDEASQVTLEEAVPSIFRAKQVLIVGDEMQLPPTSFFATRGAEEDEPILVEDASGQKVEYDLSSNSLLNHAARNLPSTMLGWHYRSRSESLISFSNAAFYQGRLLTVPDVLLPPKSIREIVVRQPAEGTADVASVLDRPVSFHFLERGLYEQRRNTAEADYIAHLVRGLFDAPDRPTIGIIAFSEAQQNEIEQALSRLAREDDEFRDRLEEEWEREIDDQFVGLLVKNLENIQGDERDIIILSVCYGPNPTGKVLMNFGPINQNGGERRLNVAFSRAKKRMAIIASIRHATITNDYNDGARALKNYLRYAEALSAGNGDAARRVLHDINPAGRSRDGIRGTHVVVEQLAERLHQRGYVVDRDVGDSDFRCDLAIRSVDGSRYILGITVDTDRHYQNADALERDLLRPRLLRNFDWTVVLVLSRDWLRDPDQVMQFLQKQAGVPGRT